MPAVPREVVTLGMGKGLSDLMVEGEMMDGLMVVDLCMQVEVCGWSWQEGEGLARMAVAGTVGQW